jgi:dolichyl-phosphate beta-glucosyltransferase
MNQNYEISFVVPAYNEARRIIPTLEKIRHYAESNFYHWEMLVVDDGSQDRTAALVKKYFQTTVCRHPLRFLTNGINRGKGFSVRQGFLESQGEIVLFTDSDLSTPIEETEKLLQPIQSGTYDGAIASRAVRGSRILVHQPFFREYGGKVFNCMVRLLAWLPFHDTQCGFKAFRRLPFLPVFQQQKIERFGFDVEILYLAKKIGLRVAEIPVLWAHCSDSKVHFTQDAFQMAGEIWSVRRNDWKGLYQLPHKNPGEKSG